MCDALQSKSSMPYSQLRSIVARMPALCRWALNWNNPYQCEFTLGTGGCSKVQHRIRVTELSLVQSNMRSLSSRQQSIRAMLEWHLSMSFEDLLEWSNVSESDVSRIVLRRVDSVSERFEFHLLKSNTKLCEHFKWDDPIEMKMRVHCTGFARLVCETFTFSSAPMFFTTGSGPTSIVSADFNRDGHVDIAVTCYDVNIVSILLGIGNGFFQSTPLNFSSNGTHPFWLICDDFNRDGYLDLAMTNEGSNTITVLIAFSNGSLGFVSDTYASGGRLPSSLTTVDLNGDGQTDLVVTNTGSDNFSVFLGRANGRFRLCGVYGTGDGPSSITHGYFNDDMKVDLAVVNRQANQLQIFFGLGDGSFISNARNYSTESVPYTVQTGDLNGDGKLDLVVANMNHDSIGIHLGTGQGTFSRPSPATYPTGGSGALGLSIVDLNHDSQMDLVIGNQRSNDIIVYFGNGDGTFGLNVTYSLPARKLQGLVAADFNEDGHDDVAVVFETSSSVAVLLAQCPWVSAEIFVFISSRTLRTTERRRGSNVL